MGVTTRSKHRLLLRGFMFPKFPPEIVADIISRLTLADISRCLFVCKAWCQNCCFLVSDPSFHTLHHSRRYQEIYPCILIFCCRIGDVRKLYMANVDGYNLGTSLKARENGFSLPRGKIELVGSANGLVCLALQPNHELFYICNPLTGDTLKLPRAASLQPYFVYGYASCGFAFDVTNNTYKVFRTWVHYQNDNVGIDIYTIGSGTWRRVEDLPYCSCIYDTPVLVNGCLHWVDDPDGTAVSILALDIADESYKLMQTLIDIDEDYDCISLDSQDGCLLIMGTSSMHCDIWIMENYGVESSWNKKSVASKKIAKADINIVGQMHNGSLLFRHNGRTCFYKLENGKVLRIGIEGLPSSCDDLEVVFHVGSLISPRAFPGSITVGKKSRKRRR